MGHFCRSCRGGWEGAAGHASRSTIWALTLSLSFCLLPRKVAPEEVNRGDLRMVYFFDLDEPLKEVMVYQEMASFRRDCNGHFHNRRSFSGSSIRRSVTTTDSTYVVSWHVPLEVDL